MNLLKYKAIIDAGSGSVKLGIYKESTTHFALNYKLVASREEKLLLNTFIKQEKLLPEAEERLVHTLNEMVDVCKLYGIKEKQITVLTTKWFKKIKEKDIFLKRMKKQTKIVNWVPLTSKHEAKLAFYAVKSTSLEDEGIVCDIGANSIEMASFFEGGTVKTKSVKLGALYVQEHFHIKARPNRYDRDNITSFVIRSFKHDEEFLGKGKDLIVLSNIGRSIFALFNHFAGIDDDPSHAKSITFPQLEETIKLTSKISYEKLMGLSNFDSQQWDVIEICMAIIRGIMIVSQSKFLVLSQTSIKEGYLAVKQEEVNI